MSSPCQRIGQVNYQPLSKCGPSAAALKLARILLTVQNFRPQSKARGLESCFNKNLKLFICALKLYTNAINYCVMLKAALQITLSGKVLESLASFFFSPPFILSNWRTTFLGKRKEWHKSWLDLFISETDNVGKA